MDKNERQSKMIKALSNLDNWGPNFTLCSKESGVPVSTLFEFYNNKLKPFNRIDLFVDIISEDEAQARFIEAQARKQRMIGDDESDKN